MRKPLLAALIATMTLTGCATVRDSRLNPFNWFGSSTAEVEPLVEARAAVVDRRPLVREVTALTVERTPGGAVIRATGLPPTQGYYAAELTQADESPPGTLSYLFRALPPREATRSGTAPSREIVVAIFVTDQQLAGISTIRVLGQENSRASRR